MVVLAAVEAEVLLITTFLIGETVYRDSVKIHRVVVSSRCDSGSSAIGIRGGERHLNDVAHRFWRCSSSCKLEASVVKILRQPSKYRQPGDAGYPWLID